MAPRKNPARAAATRTSLAPTKITKAKPFACTKPTCSLRFTTKDNMKRHRWALHEDGGAICPYCKKKFPDTRVKPAHLKKCKKEMERKEAEEKAKALEEAEKKGEKAAEALLRELGL